MKSITTFDIVLVPFPFTDLSSSKKRPCLVLKKIEINKLPPLYVLAMMTSQTNRINLEGDFQITDLKQAGLTKDTIVRTSKIFTAEQALILKKLGSLKSHDQIQFKKKWKLFWSELT